MSAKFNKKQAITWITSFVGVMLIFTIIFWPTISPLLGISQEIHFEQHILEGPNEATSISYYDLDLDGDVDLLGASHQESLFCWWENTGSGEFSYHVISNSIPSASNLQAGDIDMDGDIDLLGCASGEIILFENIGNLSFNHAIVFHSSSFVLSLKLEDINGDNYLDFVVCVYEANKVSWFENQHNLTFNEQIVTTSLGYAVKCIPYDFDNDDDVDIVAMGETPGVICWYENDGGMQNFQNHIVYSIPGMTHGITVADFDLDGDFDIGGCTIDNTGTVEWFESIGNYEYTHHIIG